MRIGISTIGFLLNNREIKGNFIDLVEEVEFVYEFNTKKPSSFGKLVSIHSPYFYTNLASLSKTHLEFSIREIENALNEGLSTVVHEGSITTRFNGFLEESIRTMKQTFTNLTYKYKNILVENITGSLFDNFNEFVNFFLEFDVNFCFDIPHYFYKEGNFNRPILLNTKFIERVKKVHISDTFEGKDLHLSIGEGAIDFKIVKSFIKDLPQDVSIIIESIPRSGDVMDFYEREITKFMEIVYE